MSGMLEKAHEAKLVRWLKKNKIKQEKAVGALLDRKIFLPSGHLLIIEMKRPGGKLSRRQEIEIESLKELGYDVEVCYTGDEAIEEVKKRLRERDPKEK